MKKRAFQKVLAFVFTLCLMAGMATVGTAETINVADYQAMLPVLDLVAGAAISASDFPVVIGDGETTLDPSFVAFFFTYGLKAGASVGITEATLADVSQQEQVLKSIFSAGLPTLEAVAQPETADEYVGFLPVYAKAAENGDTYLIGEIYRGSMPIEQMGAQDFQTLTWEDRAVYTLRKDDAAKGGYRIDGFSVGSELLLEAELQEYTNAMLIEYINTNLGFSVLYPSLFLEANVTEDQNGLYATTQDGTAAFSATRAANETGATLADYATEAAAAVEGARMNINDVFQYATVAYETADGNTVFSVYIVTGQYVYTATLTYPTSQSILYSMYTMYLENSFMSDEVSVG